MSVASLCVNPEPASGVRVLPPQVIEVCGLRNSSGSLAMLAAIALPRRG